MHTVCTVSDSGMYYHNTTAQLASESGFDRHVGEGDHDLLNQHFLLPDLWVSSHTILAEDPPPHKVLGRFIQAFTLSGDQI